MWFAMNFPSEPTSSSIVPSSALQQRWVKPVIPLFKCNIGTSWISHERNAGAAWILRDHLGIAIAHGRRSFSRVISNLDAGLLGLWWALQSAKNLQHRKIVIETQNALVVEAFQYPARFPDNRGILVCINSFVPAFEELSVAYVSPEVNLVASSIAESVTTLHKYHSYIANGGPQWLRHRIESEAV